MTVNEAIQATASLLKTNVCIEYIKWALMAEDFSAEKADTIILWARKINESGTADQG